MKNLLPNRIYDFIKTESASGILMIFFAVLAMIAANSPFSSIYKELVNYSIPVGAATESLKDWVKDVLMVFFFLLIGLELKREICEGFLSKRDQIILPLAAAAGGMVIPALIFLGFNYSNPETVHGWAIPSATDIAFALAILLILGKGIPPSIKIFLLAIAIFDDLGAIIIIVSFYSTGIDIQALIMSAIGIIALGLLNRFNVVLVIPYILLGIFLWFCFHHAGIHTTLAGVIVGLALPMRNAKNKDHSPINKFIHLIHPWVSFGILPFFAFVSAGVDLKGLNASSFLEPLPLGIALGLFFGKQIGIFGISYLLIKSKLVSMPDSAEWKHIYTVSVLAGIGFTMSLFIGMLAFSDAHIQELVKVGVISGSLLCIMWGGIILRIVLRKAKGNLF